MNLSRRRFTKLFGFGIAGAVVAGALPGSPAPLQAALPAPALTGLAVDDAIEGEWLGAEVQWSDISNVPDKFPPLGHNPHIVTKEMIGLSRREDLWAQAFEYQRIMTPEEGGITIAKGLING